VQHPYEEDAPAQIKPWLERYRAQFKDAPSNYAIFGYVIMDRLVQSMEKAGAQLTTESLAKAVQSLKTPVDVFGSPAMEIGPGRHLASDKSRLSQIQNGRWKVVIDYDAMSR